MSFFDTTPIGRIVNRFSKDIDTVDNNIPMTIHVFLATSTCVVSVIIVISYSTPIFLSVVLPLGLLYYFVQVMSPFQVCSSASYRQCHPFRSALLLPTGDITSERVCATDSKVCILYYCCSLIKLKTGTQVTQLIIILT